jgi:hypothetical protein
VLLAGCRDPDQIYREYPSQAEATAAGEVERGWLPEWIPAEARHLHLQNDVDTNEWWLRFDLDSAPAARLKRNLERVPPTAVRLSKPSRAAWWFDGLVQKEPANDAALNAQLFRRCCDPLQRSVVLAFDRNTPTVYVWTER